MLLQLVSSFRLKSACETKAGLEHVFGSTTLETDTITFQCQTQPRFLLRTGLDYRFFEYKMKLLICLLEPSFMKQEHFKDKHDA